MVIRPLFFSHFDMHWDTHCKFIRKFSRYARASRGQRCVRTNGCRWIRRGRTSYTTLAADKARYCLRSWAARQERTYLLTDRPDEARGMTDRPMAFLPALEPRTWMKTRNLLSAPWNAFRDRWITIDGSPRIRSSFPPLSSFIKDRNTNIYPRLLQLLLNPSKYNFFFKLRVFTSILIFLSKFRFVNLFILWMQKVNKF